MTRLVCICLVLIVGSAAAQTAPPAIFLQTVVPPGLKVLTQPAVQADVGLTAEQKVEVISLNDLWGRSPRTWEGLCVVWVTPDMVRAVVAQRTQEFLTKSLTKEQRSRLDQIVFQFREKEFGAHAAFAMAARDLGLRGDQLEDVQNLKGLRVEEIVKHVTSGERYEKIKDNVAATNVETSKKMAEMLTRTQRERLKELRGKPFVGKLESDLPEPVAAKKADAPQKSKPKSPPPKRAEGPRSVYPPELFGVYDFEFRYLGSGALRTELGITEQQMKSVRREIDAWESAYARLEDALVEQVANMHERSAKALDDVFTPKQRKRFDELMAQRRKMIGGREAACGYPPVVAVLRLTPIQLTALKEGKSVGDVLTKAQTETLDNYFGKPAELSPYIVDPVRKSVKGASGQPDPVAGEVSFPPGLLMRPQPEPEVAFARAFLALSNRLKLSEDQIKKLRELAEDEPKVKDLIRRELSLSETPPVAGAGRGLTVDRAVMDKYQAAVEEQCWNVLDAPQQSLARKIFGRGGR